MQVLGLLATLLFMVVWGWVTYLVITDPPDFMDNEAMIWVYVVLAAGYIVAFRSLFA